MIDIDKEIKQAVFCLQQGKLIAYPTEAVYGFGCDPFNQQAVYELLALKKRNAEKGFILVASSWQQIVELIAPIPQHALLQIKVSWPGPKTWVFPATDSVPKWISGRHASVAIRISGHPIVKALCEKFGKPIVSSSANLEGQPPARDFATVNNLFAKDVCCIINGAVGDLERPTPMRDAVTGELLRD